MSKLVDALETAIVDYVKVRADHALLSERADARKQLHNALMQAFGPTQAEPSTGGCCGSCCCKQTSPEEVQVDDPATPGERLQIAEGGLEVAKAKVVKLQAKVERMARHVAEVQMTCGKKSMELYDLRQRCDAAEARLATLCDEHRTMRESKDAEIAALKKTAEEPNLRQQEIEWALNVVYGLSIQLTIFTPDICSVGYGSLITHAKTIPVAVKLLLRRMCGIYHHSPYHARMCDLLNLCPTSIVLDDEKAV